MLLVAVCLSILPLLPFRGHLVPVIFYISECGVSSLIFVMTGFMRIPYIMVSPTFWCFVTFLFSSPKVSSMSIARTAISISLFFPPSVTLEFSSACNSHYLLPVNISNLRSLKQTLVVPPIQTTTSFSLHLI